MKIIFVHPFSIKNHGILNTGLKIYSELIKTFIFFEKSLCHLKSVFVLKKKLMLLKVSGAMRDGVWTKGRL